MTSGWQGKAIKQAPAVLGLRAEDTSLGVYTTYDGRYQIERVWEKEDGTPRRSLSAPWRLCGSSDSTWQRLYPLGQKRWRSMREAADALAEKVYRVRTEYRVDVCLRADGVLAVSLWPDDRTKSASAERLVREIHDGDHDGYNPDDVYAEVVRVYTPMSRPEQIKLIGDLNAQTHSLPCPAAAQIKGGRRLHEITEAEADKVIAALTKLRDES